jgi:phosphatidylglycerol:prolipoprotein diacylglycerol transferase
MHPTLIKIGSFEVPSFGVMIVLGFLAGLFLAIKRAPKYNITPAQVQDVAFYALISGILGARIVFIAQEWGYYSAHLNEVFSLRFAGLTSFGGLFFGMAAIAIWCRKAKVPFLVLCDIFAPAFLLAHAIGRVGCLLNGCCFGGVCPANYPVGIHIAGDERLHHPAQIYDSLMNLVALGLVLQVEKVRAFAGQIFALFMMLHGLARFIYEFWRAGTAEQVARGAASSTYMVISGHQLPITDAQVMALVMILAGGIMYFIFARRSQPEALVAAEPKLEVV